MCQCCPHIRTSPLIFTANQLTGFYMRATLAFNGLNNMKICVSCEDKILIRCMTAIFNRIIIIQTSHSRQKVSTHPSYAPPIWPSHFFMFRRLKNNVTFFFYKQVLYTTTGSDLIRSNNSLIDVLNRVLKNWTLKTKDFLSKEHYCYQNPYTINEKQCLSLPPLWKTSHFYKKILTYPSMIFQKS